MIDPGSTKSGFVTFVIAAAFVAGTAVATVLIWWLGDWQALPLGAGPDAAHLLGLLPGGGGGDAADAADDHRLVLPPLLPAGGTGRAAAGADRDRAAPADAGAVVQVRRPELFDDRVTGVAGGRHGRGVGGHLGLGKPCSAT